MGNAQYVDDKLINRILRSGVGEYYRGLRNLESSYFNNRDIPHYDLNPSNVIFFGHTDISEKDKFESYYRDSQATNSLSVKKKNLSRIEFTSTQGIILAAAISGVIHIENDPVKKQVNLMKFVNPLVFIFDQVFIQKDTMFVDVPVADPESIRKLSSSDMLNRKVNYMRKFVADLLFVAGKYEFIGPRKRLQNEPQTLESLPGWEEARLKILNALEKKMNNYKLIEKPFHPSTTITLSGKNKLRSFDYYNNIVVKRDEGEPKPPSAVYYDVFLEKFKMWATAVYDDELRRTERLKASKKPKLKL